MITVGIGELIETTDTTEIVQMLGLGSCVGVFTVVPGRLCIAAHVLLPDSAGADAPNPGKFADTAIPEIAERLKTAGVAKLRTQTILVGGGQVLSFGATRPEFDIGSRNAESVRKHLLKHGLPVRLDETGGTSARTARLAVATGKIIEDTAAVA